MHVDLGEELKQMWRTKEGMRGFPRVTELGEISAIEVLLAFAK
jgi:hypothetical protein